MAKTLTAGFILLVLNLPTITNSAESPPALMWKEIEMNPRDRNNWGEMIKIKDVSLLPVGSSSPEDPQCTIATPCYELFYTRGAVFDRNVEEKFNILYIPGGPGQIVNEAEGPGGSTAASNPKGNELLDLLAFGDDLSGRHNIVYFHVRGTGQSMIDERNTYDKYLRAKHVVEDIERLRREVLQDKPWDAIYAHSWGTLVAQLYAARKFGNDPEPRVKSLILSAPIVRKDPNTATARIDQTISNLQAIYRFFRPTNKCLLSSNANYLKNLIADFDDHLIPDLEGTDNLCFIDEAKIKELSGKVAKIINVLEDHYGSLNLLLDQFDKIEADLPNELKLQQEFFVALQKLQFLGAPKKEGLLFTADAVAMIDVSLLIGFHLTPGVDSKLSPDCDPGNKFFVGPAADPDMKKRFCGRLKKTKDNFLPFSGTSSLRARYVFGVFDGVTRWIFQVLKKRCFTGTDLREFANATLDNNDKLKHVRALARRLGGDSNESPLVCGWDPGGENAHSVPALIMAGDSDTVIAGCQAEHFYSYGLQGPKVFLQFPGQGHDMSIGNLEIHNLPKSKALADLIDQFIRTAKSAPSDFGKFLERVKSQRELLKIRVPPSENGIMNCP